MKVFLVAKWEFLQRIKSKWFIFSTLLLPIIILGFSVLPTLLMQKSTDVKTFAIIDQTERIAQELQEEMTNKYSLKDGRPRYQFIPLSGRHSNESIITADSLLSDGLITGYVVIPTAIYDSMAAEYYATTLANFNDLDRIERNLSQVIMSQKIKQHNLDQTLIKELTRRVDLQKYEMKQGEATQGNELMAFVTPYFYIMLLFFAVFMSSQILMRSVLEERQNRVVEVLISAVTPGQLMTGKILGLGAMGLVQVAIYMVVAQVVASYNAVTIVTLASLGGFLLYFIPGFLLFAAFYAAVGALFTSEQEAQQISGLLSFIAVAPIIFLVFAMENPDALLVKILSYIPPFTPFFMIMRMNISALPWYEYVTTTAVLGVFVFLTVFAAGKVFSTAILMYGKRPTLPEVLRWIRS